MCPVWTARGCGFDHVQVIQKTLKLVVMVALLGTQGCRVAGLALQLTGWCQDKWTSSTGNLPRKRRDITEQLLKAA